MLTSVAKIRSAPAAAAIPTANSPIGPQPVISTRFAVRVVAKAVWTALPNGSWAEAIAGGRPGSLRQALVAGIVTYCAKQPCRSMPIILTLRQICDAPVRQG